jgi:Ran GTPase-activating protein (RanGAP) involved in mRNA processing and transport
LNLTNARIGGEEGLMHILSLLPTMPHLETLKLDGCDLGNTGATLLAEELGSGSCCRRLKTLSLALNGIGAVGGHALAMALMRISSSSPRSSPSFTHIHTHTHPPPPSPYPLSTLSTLTLDGNLLGHKGTASLAHAFKAGACPNLLELSLKNNDVKESGLRELLNAFAAGACVKMVALHLERNLLCPGGARLLAHFFMRGACKNLQVLNLNFTFIGMLFCVCVCVCDFFACRVHRENNIIVCRYTHTYTHNISQKIYVNR